MIGRIAFLLLLGLTACGGKFRPAETPFEYQSDCLTFHSEAPLDQGRLDHNVRRTMRNFEFGPVQLPAEEFCKAFSEIRIEVADTPEFPCGNEEGACRGEFDAFTGIVLAVAWPFPLAHELLHAWDVGHAQPGTSWHHKWDENGYDAMDMKTKDESFSPRAYFPVGSAPVLPLKSIENP